MKIHASPTKKLFCHFSYFDIKLHHRHEDQTNKIFLNYNLSALNYTKL